MSLKSIEPLSAPSTYQQNPHVSPILAQLTIPPQNQTGKGSHKADESTVDKENEGPSMSVKCHQQKVKDTDNGTKLSMFKKCHGKQKVKESEDEVEEHVEKKND